MYQEDEHKCICTWLDRLKKQKQKCEPKLGFPDSDSEESVWNAGDLGSMPGSGRFPGERNGNPLQYSCLGNPMDRGAWRATVHGVAKSWDTVERLTPSSLESNVRASQTRQREGGHPAPSHHTPTLTHRPSGSLSHQSIPRVRWMEKCNFTHVGCPSSSVL